MADYRFTPPQIALSAAPGQGAQTANAGKMAHKQRRIRIRIRLLGLFQQSGYYGPVSICKYHSAKKTMLKKHIGTHIHRHKHAKSKRA